MSDKDTLAEERDAFENAHEAESENRTVALESLKFSRMGEQWPDNIRQERVRDGRPILTINRMPSFIRQVVNDSRMNRPQIKVKGVDDNSDAKTATALEGLCRNIEYVSKASRAYDLGIDNACSMGWGYLRVKIDFAYDDSFDKELRIEGVVNPFSVYGDPYSTESDSSDWNQAHVVEHIKKEEFRRRYKGAEEVDWDATGYNSLKAPWLDDEQIMVCEAWRREKVMRKIYMLSNGKVIGEKEYEAAKEYLGPLGITVTNERDANSHKITQRIMSGAEIIEENEWLGRYIPIIPVYGEEICVEGKRYFRSLVHHAMDAQRQFNYWKTAATELVALAPKVPFIGEEGAFDADPNWQTANSQSHPYLMHKRGSNMPQRQPLDSGQAVGAMSQAMQASDDMKSVIGMYDASLGQKSNETSGKAIMARQREGDVSTFHFIDNLSRAIGHTGCVLIDLIPKVYTQQKVIRVLGEDGKEKVANLAQEGQEADPANGIYDLSVGRYDVAVSTGPGFTTKREEAALQMTEFIRSYPESAPVIGDLLVKAMDWPQADEIAERIKAMAPKPNNGMPPELQQQIQEGQQQLQEQGQQIQQDKMQISVLKAEKQLDKQQHQLALAEKDLQIQSLQIGSNIAAADHRNEAAGLRSQQPPAQQQQPVNVNVPDNIGEALSSAIIPAVTQAMVAAFENMPPIRMQMPKRMRTPVRGSDGMIQHAIEEDMPDEVMN